MLLGAALIFVQSQIGLPNTARKCAQTAQIDWETSGVGECAGLDGSGKGVEGGALRHLYYGLIAVDSDLSEIVSRKYRLW